MEWQHIRDEVGHVHYLPIADGYAADVEALRVKLN